MCVRARPRMCVCLFVALKILKILVLSHTSRCRKEVGWPIPLVTYRSNLNRHQDQARLNRAGTNKSRTCLHILVCVQLTKHRYAHAVSDCNGPVMILAIHLCGQLSLRAVELFNMNVKATCLALKPCCLPVCALKHDVLTHLFCVCVLLRACVILRACAHTCVRAGQPMLSAISSSKANICMHVQRE